MGVKQAVQRREDCFPVPLGVMQPGTAPLDLFIDFGAALVLYKKRGASLADETRARLLRRGLGSLYLSRKDEQAYRQYVEDNLEAIVRDELVPPQQAARLVYESSSRVMSEVFQEPRSGGQLRRARRMVEAAVLSLVKDPASLWRIESVASRDYHTYTHCVHVGMMMAAAARDILGVSSRRELSAIALGGILHDIGKCRVPDGILSKPGRLTQEEFALIRRHPAEGLSMVLRHQNLESVSAQIIRYHHERYSGGGYPSSQPEAQMRLEVRLATIVDVYDALTTRKPYSSARTAFAALETMLGPMAGHFDPALLRAFVRFLGPHRPAGRA